MKHKILQFATILLVLSFGQLLAQPPRLFVVDTAGNALQIINPATASVTGSVPLGSQPGDPVRNSDGSRIYVPNRGSNSISVIDVASESLLTTVSHASFSQPVAVALAASGRELWVMNRTGGNNNRGSISIVDTTTHAVLAVLNSPSFNFPEHMAINRSGTRTYVVNTANGTVTVILTATRNELLNVNVGGAPSFAAVTEDGREVYVSRPADNALSRIRTQNHSVFQVALAGAPGRMTVRDNLVYVALGNNQVAVVDSANGRVDSIGLSSAAINTFAVALISGASRGYVTDSAFNRIRAFDPFTRSEVMGGGFPITLVAQPRGLVTTGVLASIDLALTKTAGAPSFGNGAEASFTLRIDNAGPSPANDVRVTDPLPAGLTFVSATPSQGTCGLNGSTVECSLGRLEATAFATIVLRARTTEEGMLTNTAEVAAAEADSNLANNTASASINVTPLADLEIMVTDEPDPAAVGQILSYNIRVSNLGGSLASNVRLTAVLPSGADFVSAEGGGANCTPGATAVLCNLSAILGGNSFELAIRVIPRSAGFLLFSAVVQTTTFDPDSDNNSVTVQTVVTGAINNSDLEVSKSVVPQLARRGGQAVYTIEVRNNGPEPTPSARVRETLPLPGLNLQGFNNPFGSCEVVADGLLCRLGELGVGQSKSIQLTFQLTPQARGRIVNTAETETAGMDPESSNNTSSAELLVEGSADFNQDGVVDAADLQVLILELTDGDGENADAVAGGSFIGTPEMDLTHDGLITTADADVLIRLIFAVSGG